MEAEKSRNNRMRFNDELEARLQHWALWVYSFISGEQGYPKESFLSKCIKQGFQPSKKISRSSSIPFYNQKAEEVNTIFNQLKSISPELADAVFYYYLSKEKVCVLADKRSIAKNTFYKRVREAKKFIGERL